MNNNTCAIQSLYIMPNTYYDCINNYQQKCVDKSIICNLKTYERCKLIAEC